MNRFITPTILALSLVSLFTDFASEMLYPVMPMFLRSIGFSVAMVGLLEGIAEATAGLSKGYFGNLSDHLGRRRIFVQVGYTLSAISKPLMAVVLAPVWVAGARTLDRLGKGCRTAARDAMLAAETTAEYKGRVFGFHRAFDTVGAVLGPAAALVFLGFYPDQYRLLFLVAFVPGLIAVSITAFLKERQGTLKGRPPSFLSYVQYWRRSPASYRTAVTAFIVFALINSSDILLLMLMKEQGADDKTVILSYIIYNTVYALASYPLGALADRWGFRRTYIVGMILFAGVYAGVALVHSEIAFIVLLSIYGVYAASTESVSKAWITNIAPPSETGTAIGFLTSAQSVAALFASAFAGWLWIMAGSIVPFLLSAAVALSVAVFLSVRRI